MIVVEAGPRILRGNICNTSEANRDVPMMQAAKTNISRGKSPRQDFEILASHAFDSVEQSRSFYTVTTGTW